MSGNRSDDAGNADVLEISSFDSYDYQKAKQRASVLWLMSKAYDNNIPSNLLEPYYRDHEGQDQLKPNIVHALANAELYCLALGNIFSDQNYHSLNHHGVIMLLQRKGVYVVEPADVSLTETVLVQVAPIRMTAHMAVIEAVMALYIKEILVPDKIIQCVKKFTSVSGTDLPADPEDAIVMWINKACAKMGNKINNIKNNTSFDSNETGDVAPISIPSIQDLSDLNDGCCLALLLSFYCPDYFSWQDICLNDSLSLADSLYNLQLVLKFCEHTFPYDFYFLSLEDVLYMHSSIRQNILAFLADLFHVLEVKPAKCVKPPGLKDHKIHIPASKVKLGSNSGSSSVAAGVKSSKQITSPIPDLRNTNHTFDFSPPPSHLSSKSPFLKGISIPKKPSRKIEGQKSPVIPVQKHSPSVKANGEHRSSDVSPENEEFYECDEESPVDELPAAGIPSSSKRLDASSIPARSKIPNEKNVAETKPLENIEQDKNKCSGIIGEANVVLTSITGSPRRTVPNCSPMWSALTGIPGFHQVDTEIKKKVKSADEDVDPYKEYYRERKEKEAAIYNELAKIRESQPATSSVVGSTVEDMSSSHDSSSGDSSKQSKKTTFATMPKNTTTWQQQIQITQAEAEPLSPPGVDAGAPLTSQLNNVRLELEEKRRKIELEKKKMEMMWNRQRQKVGKAAFLQAVSKGQTDGNKSNEGTEGSRSDSISEIAMDLDYVKKKWLDDASRPEAIQEVPTPDSDKLSDDYHSSIDKLNSNLSELQIDIGKLSKQQEAIQKIVHQQHEDQQQQQPQNFFLHHQPRSNEPSPKPQPMSSMVNVPHSHSSMPAELARSDHGPMSLDQQQTMFMQQQRNLPPQMVSQPHHSYMGGQQQWSSPQDMHQRAQWGAPPTNQDLMNASPRRAQWTQQDPQSLNQSPQRNMWYLPKQEMQPPIMSAGQYPMAYNHPEYFAQDPRNRNYYPQQFGQLDNSPYSYQSPPQQMYQQSHPYQPYTSQPMTTSPYEQQQSIPFRLHDQQNVQPPVSIPSSINQPTLAIPPTSTIDRQPVNDADVYEDHSDAIVSRSETLSTSPRTEHKHQLGKTFRVPKPKHRSSPDKQMVSPPPPDTEDLPTEEELTSQPIKDGADSDLGFFVSFEDEQPVKPKPKFRAKSAGQTRSTTSSDNGLINPFRSSPSSVGAEKLNNPFQSSNATNTGTFNKQSELINPFRKNVPITDKSSPLHQIGERQNDRSANSSTHSVPDILSSSPVPQDDYPTENGQDDESEVHSGVGFIIGADLVNPDPDAEDEMARRKEKIMMMSLKRKARQESRRSFKEKENAKIREIEQLKKEMLERKKDEEKLRRQMIFEQYKQRKAAEVDEAEGHAPDQSHPTASRTLTKSRTRSARQRRPKSHYNHGNGMDNGSSLSARGSTRGSQPNLSGYGDNNSYDVSDSMSNRRTMSPPPTSRRVPSPGPSLPGGYYGRSGPPSDDACSIASDYCGPKLFVKPTSKSNRGILVNAVNTVLGGHVNADTKQHCIEEINRSESKHFLILFRDQGLKFRSLYSYNPDREEVLKLYGTGPKQITEKMIDKFFKYNSGGKSFSAIHTKHLTVTIDAITIHNSLWQGKKVIPTRRDYF